MKKTILKILSLLFLGSFTLGIYACTTSNEHTNSSPAVLDVYTLETVYAKAQELGYDGSLEDFLKTVTGKDGVGINNIYFNADKELIVELTDGTVKNLGSLTLNEETATYSENLAYTVSTDKSYYILRDLGLCTDRDIVIPEQYRGLPVKEIAASAFTGDVPIDSITIPTSIAKIERNDGFNGDVYFLGTLAQWCAITHDNSEGSIISNGKLYIDGKAIEGDIAIPNTVTSLADGIFYGYEFISSVTIPSSVTQIGKSAFWGCNRLTSVTIPSSVRSIKRNAFRLGENCPIYCETTEKPEGWDLQWTNSPVVWDCNNNDVANDGFIYTLIDGLSYRLTNGTATVTGCHSSVANLVIPDTVTYKNVVYPVTVIAPYAFDCREHLTSVIIGNNITDIAALAFSNNKNLTSVVIGNGVSTISSNAFAACENLTEVILGNSVSMIMSFAFTNCIRLAELIIPSSVCEIGVAAFGGCISLASVVFETPTGWKNLSGDILDFSDPAYAAEELQNGFDSYRSW